MSDNTFTIEEGDKPITAFPSRLEFSWDFQFRGVDANSKVEETHSKDSNDDSKITDELSDLRRRGNSQKGSIMSCYVHIHLRAIIIILLPVYMKVWSYLGWEERCSLEILQVDRDEESSKEEDAGEQVHIWVVVLAAIAHHLSIIELFRNQLKKLT